MMEGPRKYTPTPIELKKAASRMNPEEAKLTAGREKIDAKWKELAIFGLKGDLRMGNVGSRGGGDFISGEINGQTIALGKEDSGLYWGRKGSKYLSPSEAKSEFEGYLRLGIVRESEHDEERNITRAREAAKQEVEEFQRQQEGKRAA
jgi:hypothetical protein